MHAFTIPAATINHIELTSPLTLLAILAVSAAAIATAWKLKRYGFTIAAATAALILVSGYAIVYASSNVGKGLYGIWINGTKAYIHFWAGGSVNVDLCNTNITLVPTNAARDLLRIRVDGLGDPTTGVSMGYYRTRDGEKAYVLIVEGRKALLIKGKEWVAIVAVPGVEECYRAALAAQTNCTRK